MKTAAVIGGYGHKPNISYLPMNEFMKTLSENDAIISKDHISRSPACSMEKTEKLLGFVPKYSAIDMAISALNYAMSMGELV